MEIVQVDIAREKPILLELKLKDGSLWDCVIINHEVPTIKGFLAIESQDTKFTTKYIALDTIESFSVLDREICNIVGSFPD